MLLVLSRVLLGLWLAFFVRFAHEVFVRPVQCFGVCLGLWIVIIFVIVRMLGVFWLMEFPAVSYCILVSVVPYTPGYEFATFPVDNRL